MLLQPTGVSSYIPLIAGDAFNLFAFPSECNFTGLRFCHDLVNIIKGNSESILEGTAALKYAHFIKVHLDCFILVSF